MASSLTKDPPSLPTGPEKTFFGHPRGLATLFMTEMWERFSFYGMKALLTIYLLSGGPDASKGLQPGGLGMDLATTTAVYSIYLSMVYLLALPGGWLGDRVWGPRRTVTIAACTIMTGHLVLALPGSRSFFAGLALVALGSGLLKANISTMVGHLYDNADNADNAADADNAGAAGAGTAGGGTGDPRRDGGFTVFYMGINLGAFFAPLVIGTVGETYDWHLGFVLAAVGMGIGLLVFLLGTRHLSPRSSVVPTPLSREERATWLRRGMAWLLVAAVIYGAVGLSGHFTPNWAMVPLTLAGVAVPAGVLIRIKRDKELTSAEQSRMSGYIWFFVAAAVFWMIYDQGGSTVQAFGTTRAAGRLFGLTFPTSWYQSLNPVFIMALAPVAAWFWLWLNRGGQGPGTVAKFAAGLFFVGVSFLFFLVPLVMSGDGTLVSPMWLVGIYLIQTVGELCVSPVGLSVTTRTAPVKYASQMMGVWFLAVTAGDSVTGMLSIAGADLSRAGVVALEAVLAVAAGGALFMYRRRVRALMGDIH
ncbi:peptide MFS transporter [Streptomyces lushanensis]|uniref:peptide MFS transporter n=1 Tax=Streptomyces lushanensis TaxID=1434255 RepID=UPI0008356116|nr:oligopeptide:H+ symporter [Streptomyces lushanensis]